MHLRQAFDKIKDAARKRQDNIDAFLFVITSKIEYLQHRTDFVETEEMLCENVKKLNELGRK